MNLIFKGLLAAFWLVLMPGAAGLPFFRKKEKLYLGESFLMGYVFLFGVMEALTLPMVYLGKVPLHVLTACFGVISLAMAVWGSRVFWEKRRKKGGDFPGF